MAAARPAAVRPHVALVGSRGGLGRTWLGAGAVEPLRAQRTHGGVVVRLVKVSAVIRAAINRILLEFNLECLGEVEQQQEHQYSS